MNPQIKKIGFACKLVYEDSKKGIINVPECNVSTTTITWLNKQSRDTAVEKLWHLLKNNISAITNLVNHVGKLDPELRMVRIGSDILPAYTHEDWKWFWKQTDVIDFCERNFLTVGEIARKLGVRLSMHPGQFVVLSSDNESIVSRSIDEFEYHTDMARWMGYGKQFQDFKINVHISGKQGPEGIKKAYGKLSNEARNCITIENEEITHGLNTCLSLSNIVPIVLDIHHHWVREGEYINFKDQRVRRIIDSWRGVRPVVHYSISREDLLINHSKDVLPQLQLLINQGYNKSKLRAHSDFMWNHAVNKWALEHYEWADLMIECKSKNLGAHQLYKFYQNS